jgi:hypothetical protein
MSPISLLHGGFKDFITGKSWWETSIGRDIYLLSILIGMVSGDPWWIVIAFVLLAIVVNLIRINRRKRS